MKKQHSAETLRKRKFLLVLPLLVFPFLTMAFWALGGGKGQYHPTMAVEGQKGFNTELPEAKFNPDEKQDKFSIYETAVKSSEADASINPAMYNRLEFPTDEAIADPNEQKINEKLSLINAELNRQSNSSVSNYRPSKAFSNSHSSISSDVDRLENLMQNLQSAKGDDPEMAQLNGVLEKILEIQNPGREKVKERKNSNGVYSVTKVDGESGNSSLYSIVQNLQGNLAESHDNTIQATIHQDQEVVSGSVVKLRLLDSIMVNGAFIPKNEFVYGIAEVNGERLKIEIESFRYKNAILPVSLAAYDMDGLEGLYIPGAISRDASKRGADDAIQSLQIMTMDPSISAQVAGAGVEAAKGIFSRKVKQVRVKVKAGYQLLLRDNNQRN